jgi:hypothetical protein
MIHEKCKKYTLCGTHIYFIVCDEFVEISPFLKKKTYMKIENINDSKSF